MTLLGKLTLFPTAAAAITVCASIALYSSEASALSEAECKQVADATMSVFKDLAKAELKLSPKFNSSLLGYIITNGELTCDGPKTVYASTPEDRATILTIDEYLKKKKIGLANAGVKLVIVSPEPK